ncbi:unnamed protein product, partial [Angiostrongylus costaricensis]|uniref:Protein kinase domain-containing protein n=1 Tax=Angiostrongylus costaricensis TaxID=334426 RepID=A0A0R3PVW1_ANGCS
TDVLSIDVCVSTRYIARTNSSENIQIPQVRSYSVKLIIFFPCKLRDFLNFIIFRFIQDFEPVKLLGHGGFGVVFEARNRLDECPYAVKRIAVANSERAIQLVLREVRAMAKLDHPGIIRYYHTWIERPPRGWQVKIEDLQEMAFICVLTNKMKVWMVQMCSAVSYIHRQGLIHRDIKPQNIFFASDHALKVGDLGLVTRYIPTEDPPAEKSSSGFMVHTDNVGTRGYMSPEQVCRFWFELESKPYTFKVDVFSLGLIFCELVIPFQTLMERCATLRSLQQGKIPDALNLMPSEVGIVEPECRPTCDEILDSDYLTQVESQTVDGNRANVTSRRSKSRTTSSNISFSLDSQFSVIVHILFYRIYWEQCLGY